MSSVLPHLTSLRNIVAGLAASADQGAAAQAGIAARLLDHMIVREVQIPAFEADCYAELQKLLLAIRAAGGPADELERICTRADPGDFERFLALTAELQLALVNRDEAESTSLARSIADIEGRYRSKIDAAVDAQMQAANQRTVAPTTARNSRSYDEKELLGFIRRSFPAEPEVTISRCELVSGGFSKFTLGIVLENTRSLPTEIILRGDASTTFGGASVVDEYRLLNTVYKNGVCVAKPLALEESGQVIGSPFMLVEKRPNVVIGHQFGPPAPNKAICDALASSLAAVHLVPLDALQGVNGMDMKSSRKISQWIDDGFAKWDKLAMPSPVFTAAFEWLRRHVGINDAGPRALVHGDYVLNNILIQHEKVTAILDWEFAHVGNPAYDLGYSYFLAKNLASWEDYLAAYGKAGAPVPGEDQLNYHILLAATRLGVMVSQVTHSFVSGADSGTAGAVVVGDNYYEKMIMRITEGLDRVL